MQAIIQDFVNRNEELDFLWDMARQQVEPRILVVEAEDGMGKTYLLEEFRAECQEESNAVVCLDFAERYEDPGYMYVIKESWSQLGPVGFDLLAQTIQETLERSVRKTAQESWQDFQDQRQVRPEPVMEGNPPGEMGTPASIAAGMAFSQAVPAGLPAGERSGGVNITGGTNTFRDVAGRDILHFIQVIQQEDPFVQIQARNWISEAFKQCLAQIAAQRSIVFFIDHWQKAEPTTRNWLGQSLVKWTADRLLARACVVIAGLEGVELAPRRLLKRILLPELDEEAVYAYLVDVCKLQAEDVPKFFEIAGGVPLLLSMAVNRRGLVRRPR